VQDAESGTFDRDNNGTFETSGALSESGHIPDNRDIMPRHINRFGDYILNLGRKPPQPDYGYTLKRTASAR